MARHFRPLKLFRRLSSRSDSHPTSPASSAGGTSPPPAPVPAYSLRKARSVPKLRKRAQEQEQDHNIPPSVPEQRESLYLTLDLEGKSEESNGGASPYSESPTLASEQEQQEEFDDKESNPILCVEQPTPDGGGLTAIEDSSSLGPRTESGEVTLAGPSLSEKSLKLVADEPSPRHSLSIDVPTEHPADEAKPVRPVQTAIRKPSIVDSANAKVVATLIDAPTRRDIGLPTSAGSSLPASDSLDYLPTSIQGIANMLHRKVWVKRPGASPTLVQIKEDDLVDDVRDTILRKYANSLGKTFDAPDMVLHIITRAEQGQNRTQRQLGPEEEMCKTIDSYYPGGQTVDEALVIDTPQRRTTPRPSPKVFHHPSYQATDEYRPLENGNDYFPPMPAMIPTTIPQTTTSNDSRGSHNHHHSLVPGSADHPRSISVLNTGQIPPLPSPGGTTRRHHNRPKYNRLPTSSPTILSHPNAGAVAVNPPNTINPHMMHRGSTRPRMDSTASEAHPNGIPAAPPLPTPPAPEAPSTNQNASQPPTPSGGPPHLHRTARPKKTRRPTPDNPVAAITRRKKESSGTSSPHPATSLLDGSVPPINVLIVEDNIINLRILEGLMKRLKVRWQTAMNGQIAVDKWKTGGFHLVLMDIQMPVMTGLQATKEIRRLERVNGIGVFSSTSPDTDGDRPGSTADPDADKLEGMADGLFKSPIIIVALTASSLQSDRHEALAAGCNDFLTKPVNFVWLERKVKEWGCMQALIDFDGWRKWKDYAAQAEAGKSEEEKRKDAEREAKEKVKMEKMAKLQEKQAALAKEKERKKRFSINTNTSESGAAASESNNNSATQSHPSSSSGLRSGIELLGESGFNLS